MEGLPLALAPVVLIAVNLVYSLGACPAGTLSNRIKPQQSSLGERLSDRVAAVGGSWAFIGTFALVLAGWMVLNTEVLSHWGLAFDPYPYIFLNLMLSTLAAIQAPIIMMSQNRQSAKDRVAAQLDYRVNLRPELEILVLHEKIDRHVAEVVSRIERKLDTVLAGGPE